MPPKARHEEFMRLFLRSEPRIFAFIRSLVFSRADADNILQETALVLWEKFVRFEPGSHFDRWAFRVAHFQVMYHRQKKARDRLRFSDALVEQLGHDMVAESEHLEATQDADIVVTGTTGSAVVRIRGENTMFVLSSDTRMWLAREGASKIMLFFQLLTPKRHELLWSRRSGSHGARLRVVESSASGRTLDIVLCNPVGAADRHDRGTSLQSRQW